MTAIPEDELRLADAIVAQGIAPRDKVDECLSELRAFIDSGVPPPRLIDLLLQKGGVTTSNAEATVRPSPAAPAATPGPAPTQSLQARYAVSGEIARGGMGIILDGKDLEIRRDLAIKVLIDDSSRDRTAKFIEEAQIQGQLEHPNICPVHELGRDGRGRPYFTMKKVRGRSLFQILEALRDGKAAQDFTLPRLLGVFTRVCDAVAFAHSKGVLHRDLKPQNIMIGEFGEVLVMDWGLAKIAGRRDAPVVSDRADNGMLLSIEGTVMGTPAYMPPEQARGRLDDIDERSDVYALGAVLYSILTLQPPVEAPTLHATLDLVERGQIVPPSRRAPSRPVPADLEAAALKALARRPADRYPSVTALKADVLAFLEGRALAAAEYSLLQLAAKWVKRNKVFALTAGVALLLLAGSGLLYVVDIARERARAEAEARRARAAERDAQLRLAEGLVAQGDALGLAGRWGEARARFAEGRDAFRRVGEPDRPAELGLAEAFRRSPLPIFTVEARSGGLFGGTLSADGRLAVTAGADSTARLWDVTTGRELRALAGHSAAVWGAAFSPDGRTVVTGSWDQTAKVWDVGSGRPAGTFVGHRGEVYGVAVSPDGRLALSGGADRAMRLWEIPAGREVRAFAHAAAVLSVAFSPDGTRALSGGDDLTLRLWELDTGRAILSARAHRRPITTVAFSPDGKLALSGSKDGDLRLWDLESGSEVRTLRGHSNTVWRAIFSPDGKRALSCGNDLMLRVWDIETGRELRALSGHADHVYGAAFFPDGRRAFSASWDGTYRLWDTGEDEASFAGQARCVVLSRDARLALSGAETGGARLWDVATGRLIARIGGSEGHLGADFAPDGRRLVTAATDGVARVWDLATGHEGPGLQAGRGPLVAAAFSPDGRTVLTGGADGTVRQWDAESCRELRSLTGHSGIIMKVAFLDGGRRAISASTDNSLRVWDLESGREIRMMELGDAHGASGFALSPDGRFALAGPGRGPVTLWEIETGRQVRAFPGHTNRVTGFAFTDDGRGALTGGWDKTLRFWDVGSGRELRTFSLSDDEVQGLALAPGSRWALVAAGDRLRRLDLFAPDFAEAAARLEKALSRPDDPESLAAFGAWYALQGAGDWAADFLERALASGAKVAGLDLARAAWSRGDLALARREFERARSAGEAPALYADLCIRAVTR